MKRIDEIIDGVIRDIGLKKAMDERDVIELWSDIAGPNLAKKTKALSFRDGCLLVSVENPSLRAQLAMRGPELIERFRRCLGRPLVKSIRFGRRS